MKIYSLTSTSLKPNKYNNKKAFYLPKTLKKDTVSFSGNLKKTDFKGIDLAFIEKYKIDISGLKSVKGLQDIAREKIEGEYLDIYNDGLEEYFDASPEINRQRNDILKHWWKYIFETNDAYTPVMQYIILSGITANLKSTNEVLPPTLNPGALAKTITQIEEKLNKNPKESFNFEKMYHANLLAVYFGDEAKIGSKTGWVIIPSRRQDRNNFSENVEKLQTLSHSSWCTKTYNALPYLSGGEFHVYLENGSPKLGVRFEDDEIAEIQGPMNNTKIPLEYYEIVKNHIKDGDYQVGFEAKLELDEADRNCKQVEKIRNELGKEAINNCDAEKILSYFGIETLIKDKNGRLIISHYEQPDPDITYQNLGINETKLFRQIRAIKGDANLTNSNINNLIGLEAVCGRLIIPPKTTIGPTLFYAKNASRTLGYNAPDEEYSDWQLEDSAFEQMSENFNKKFNENKESLRNLFSILGIPSRRNEDGTYNIYELDTNKLFGKNNNVLFRNILNKILSETAAVQGDVNINTETDLKTLGQLKSIGGNLTIGEKSNIEDFGALTTVKGNVKVKNKNFKSLGSLRKVGGDLDVSKTKIQRSRYLTKVGKSFDISNTPFKKVDNLLSEVGDKIIVADSSQYDDLFDQFEEKDLEDKLTW